MSTPPEAGATFSVSGSLEDGALLHRHAGGSIEGTLSVRRSNLLSVKLDFS
ncbi:MAG: hypothetical protein WB808_01920 [Candidatus Dormiibacterota bacterium]